MTIGKPRLTQTNYTGQFTNGQLDIYDTSGTAVFTASSEAEFRSMVKC